jgi:hypothetical protein
MLCPGPRRVWAREPPKTSGLLHGQMEYLIDETVSPTTVLVERIERFQVGCLR